MKKIVCLILSILLVMSISAPVMADQNPTTIHGLKYNRELIERIANGDDFLVTADPLAKAEKVDDSSGGDITIQWASGGADHTHQFLTANALKILDYEKSDKVKNLLNLYASTLLYNSDWPDTFENDGGLYFSHFYNPNTGKTFWGSTTALNRFTTHANNAKRYYAKNKPLAMQELGRALHYLADINEPHHAALEIAVFSNHTQYEEWVDAQRLNYIVSNSSLYSSVPYDAKRYFASYCTTLFRNAAFHAYALAEDACSDSTYLWGITGQDSMGYAQESMAAFLFNFLYAVGAIRI